MKFEHILSDCVGGFGRYQVLIVCLISVCGTYNCLFTMEVIFSTGKMEYWCDMPRPEKDINLTQNEWRNKSVPWVNSPKGLIRDECNYYTDAIRENTSVSTPNHENRTLSQCSQFSYDSATVKSSIFNEWNLVCGKSYLIALVKSAALTGKGLGFVFGGFVSDRFGRKRAMIITSVVSLVGRLLTIFAVNLPLFMVAQALTLFGQAVLYSAGFTLSLELVSKKWRAIVGTLLAEMYALGLIVLALYGYLFRYRLTLHIASTLTFLTVIPIIWFIPESPMWLIGAGRAKEAMKILHLIAKRNSKALPDDLELETFEPEVKDGHAKNESATLYFAKQVMKSGILMRRVMILLVLWFVANITYYGLTMNMESFTGTLYLNLFIAGLLELIAAFLAQFVINTRLGRKTSTSALYIVSGAALLLIMAVPSDKRIISTVLAVFGRTCCAAYYTIIYIWTAELFPTALRNSSITLCSAFGKIASAISPFIGELSTISTFLPMIILAVIGLISGILALLVPETRGVPLPQTVNEMLTSNTRKTNVEISPE